MFSHNSPRTERKIAALSPEESLLVLCTRLNLSSDDAFKMDKILQANIDWIKVEQDSLRLGVQPLLYRHLSQERFSIHVPQKLIATLKENYRLTVIKNLWLYSQLNTILHAMNRANIPLILLKGTYLAEEIYKDIGLRPMVDIDVLCKEQDVQIVTQVLFDLGYRQEKQGSIPQSSTLPKSTSNTHGCHLTFIKPRGVMIEVHVDIFYRVSDDPEMMKRVWETADIIKIDGTETHFLSHEFQILFLSIHLHRHISQGDWKLFWFCDINELIIKYQDQIDWASFCSLVDSLNLGNRVGIVFDLLISHWSSPIFKKDLLYEMGASYNPSLKFLLSHDSKNSNFRYAPQINHIKMLKGLKNRIRYLTSFVFPSRAHLIHTYHIQSTFVQYLYYVMRPLILSKNVVVSLFRSNE